MSLEIDEIVGALVRLEGARKSIQEAIQHLIDIHGLRQVRALLQDGSQLLQTTNPDSTEWNTQLVTAIKEVLETEAGLTNRFTLKLETASIAR